MERPPALREGYPAYISFAPDRYEELLEAKKAPLLEAMRERGWIGGPQDGAAVAAHVVRSPPEHFRMRARFQVALEGGELQFVMWEGGRPAVVVNDFRVASVPICRAMAALRRALPRRFPELSARLEAVSFLSSTLGEVLVTLIYGPGAPRCLLAEDERAWLAAAEALRGALAPAEAEAEAEAPPRVSVLGRCRGAAACAGRDWVAEELSVGGRRLRLKQVERGFSNPNAAVNAGALAWLGERVRRVGALLGRPPRLLELYCGAGNHTALLAAHCGAIVGVEINAALVAAGNETLALNGAANAHILRGDSHDFCAGVLRRGACRVDGEEVRFDAVLLDPPRKGLDAATIELARRYAHVIYVSCNPSALLDNLRGFADSHRVDGLAVLDQFPFTEHLEAAVHLVRR